MKKSTKTKTPAAPQVKKSASSTKKKAVGTKPAVKKATVAPAKKKTAAKKAAAPKKTPSAVKKAVVKKATVKKVAVKKTAVKKAAVKKVAVKKAAVKKAVVKKAAIKKVAVKKVAAKTPVKKVTKKVASPKKKTATKTVITAKINVGFGNTLFLRGEGPGLSWDVGAPMNCAGDDEWTSAIAGAKAPVVAKFLVNDVSWSTGRDFEVAAGSSVVLEPSF